MPASNTNRRDTYFTGDNASGAQEGHLWVDSTNNRILVFRNGAWRTPSIASPTFSGTTTVTTLTSTTINNSGTTTSAAMTVQSLLLADTVRVTGVASLAATNFSGAITTAAGVAVASLLTADTVRVTGVASLAATNVNGALTVAGPGVSFTTPAAGTTGKIVLGTAAVPTSATSTSGFVQISALPGTPVGQSAVPATGTVFLSFDTTRGTLIVNAAGSWFAVPSLTIY